MAKEITTVPFSFTDSSGFAMMQRAAQLLAASTLVPQQFRGNVADCVIAIEAARRLGASPLAVMQSMYVIQGRPSWSAQFIIGCLNSSGRFSPLRFEMSGTGGGRACVAWATDLASGDRIEGPEVSIVMAKAEGWYARAGSKWQTMPELMLRYRAATFFGRLHAPDIMMGMQTQEEQEELEEDRIIGLKPPQPPDDGQALARKIRRKQEEVDHTPTPGIPLGSIGADEAEPPSPAGAQDSEQDGIG